MVCGAHYMFNGRGRHPSRNPLFSQGAVMQILFHISNGLCSSRDLNRNFCIALILTAGNDIEKLGTMFGLVVFFLGVLI